MPLEMGFLGADHAGTRLYRLNRKTKKMSAGAAAALTSEHCCSPAPCSRRHRAPTVPRSALHAVAAPHRPLLLPARRRGERRGRRRARRRGPERRWQGGAQAPTCGRRRRCRRRVASVGVCPGPPRAAEAQACLVPPRCAVDLARRLSPAPLPCVAAPCDKSGGGDAAGKR